MSNSPTFYYNVTKLISLLVWRQIMFFVRFKLFLLFVSIFLVAFLITKPWTFQKNSLDKQKKKKKSINMILSLLHSSSFRWKIILKSLKEVVETGNWNWKLHSIVGRDWGPLQVRLWLCGKRVNVSIALPRKNWDGPLLPRNTLRK